MAQFMRVKGTRLENLHGLVKNYIDREWRNFKAGKPCELMEKDVTAYYYSEDGDSMQHSVTVLFVNSYYLFSYINYYYCNHRPTIEKYFSNEHQADEDYRLTNKASDFDLWFLMELYRNEIKSFQDMILNNSTLVSEKKIVSMKKASIPEDVYIFLRNPFEDESINHSSDCCLSPAITAFKNTLDHINDFLENTSLRRFTYDTLRQVADEMMMIPTSDEICDGLRQCLERELTKNPNREIQISVMRTENRYHYLQKCFNLIQDARCCDIRIKDLPAMDKHALQKTLKSRYVFFNQFADKINLIGTYVSDLWRFPEIHKLEPPFFDIIHTGYITDPIEKHMVSWITEVFNMYMGGCWLNDDFTVENGYMIRSVLERYGLCIQTRTEEKDGARIVYFENCHRSFIDHLEDILFISDEKMPIWLATEQQMKSNQEYGHLVSETQQLQDYLYALLLENPETKKRYVTELQDFSFMVLLRLYWENISVIERIQTASFRWNPITVIPNYREAVELIYELFLYRSKTKSNPFEDIGLVIPSKEFAEYLYKYHLCGGEYCMGHTLEDFPTVNDHYVNAFIGHRVSTEPTHDQMLVALLYSICSSSSESAVITQNSINDMMRPNFRPDGNTNQLCIADNPKVYLEIPAAMETYGILTWYKKDVPNVTKATMSIYNPYVRTRTLNLENCKLLAPYIKKLVQTSAAFKKALFSIDKFIFIKQIGMFKAINGQSVPLNRPKDVDPSAILFVSYIMSES